MPTAQPLSASTQRTITAATIKKLLAATRAAIKTSRHTPELWIHNDGIGIRADDMAILLPLTEWATPSSDTPVFTAPLPESIEALHIKIDRYGDDHPIIKPDGFGQYIWTPTNTQISFTDNPLAASLLAHIEPVATFPVHQLDRVQDGWVFGALFSPKKTNTPAAYGIIGNRQGHGLYSASWSIELDQFTASPLTGGEPLVDGPIVVPVHRAFAGLFARRKQQNPDGVVTIAATPAHPHIGTVTQLRFPDGVIAMTIPHPTAGRQAELGWGIEWTSHGHAAGVQDTYGSTVWSVPAAAWRKACRKVAFVRGKPRNFDDPVGLQLTRTKATFTCQGGETTVVPVELTSSYTGSSSRRVKLSGVIPARFITQHLRQLEAGDRTAYSKLVVRAVGSTQLRYICVESACGQLFTYRMPEKPKTLTVPLPKKG